MSVSRRSFLLDDIGIYHVMVHRHGDNYHAVWQCCKCGFDEYQEPIISQNYTKALDAARALAEQHYGQMHGRYAQVLAAADVLLSRQQYTSYTRLAF